MGLALVELAKVGALGPNAGPLLLEASSLPNKRQVVEKLEQSAQQPNPAAELQMRGEEAKVGKLEAEAALTGAKAVTEKLMGAAQVAQAMNPQPQAPPPGV